MVEQKQKLKQVKKRVWGLQGLKRVNLFSGTVGEPVKGLMNICPATAL